MAKEFEFAYVGQIVANGATFQDPAFSRAGQIFQESLLNGLKHAGVVPSLIISAFPVRTFRRSRRIFYAGDQVTLSEGMRVNQVPFLNITPLKEISIGIATIFSLIKWGRRVKTKRRVVFTYNLTVPPGIFTLIGARLVRAKCVVAIYDINIPGQTVPANLWRRIDYWLQRKLLPLFDGHISVTDAIMRDFAPGKHYLLLEGGVSKEVLDIAKKPPIKPSPTEKFTILAAGRLDEANGIPEILEAFSLLAGDSYRLVVAGDGMFRGAVEDAARLDHRIQYLGYVGFNDLLAFYQQASVLVCMRITKRLNTKYFFPSKTMEYLSSMVPVVSTCTGNLAEEYSGLLYLLYDETPEGLAALLRSVAQKPFQERAAMARNAAAFMARHKIWDEQARRVADYLRDSVLVS